MGGAYVTEGHYQAAIDAFNRSIELRPSVEAYNNLGYAYILMHRFPEAITALQEGLKFNEHEWMNWGNLGDALYWSPDRRAQAAPNYQRAIAIGQIKLQVNSRDAEVLAYLANYSAMLNDREAAFSFLQKALEVAPGDGETMLRAAIVCHHFGQKAETFDYLRKALKTGYSRSIIRDTPDFQDLQGDPVFLALVG